MTFVAGQVLTAAELNVLDITSLTVDTDTLVVDATNDRVGINQASPSVALDVGGSVVIDDDLTVDTSTLKVDSTNNRVGIGTATPGLELSVDGQIDMIGTARAIKFGRQDEGGPHGLEAHTSSGVEGALYYRTTPNSWSFEDSSGTKIAEFDTDDLSTSFGGAVGITGVLTPAEIDAFQDGNSVTSSTAKFLFGRSSSQAIAFHGGANGNYITSLSQTSNPKPMRIFVSKDDGATGVDFVFDTLGLGVGTSPAVPLHVLRSSSGEVVRLQTNSGAGQGPYISFRDTTSRVGYMGFPNNDDLHVKNETSAGRIYLSTNNTTRMTVHQNGNVGIGITTAPGKLQVLSQNRAVSVLDSGVTNYAELGMTNSGSDAPALGYISAYGIVTRTGTSRGGLANRYTIASNGYHYINSAFPGVSSYYTVRRRNSDGLLGYASSSQRYKENIVDADDTWRQIYDLRPRDFDWRDSMFDGDPTGVPDDRSDYGLIAEEANLVMPSIVQWSTPPPSDDDTETPPDPVIEAVDYEKLSTYFLPAIQDLNARVATLEDA